MIFVTTNYPVNSRTIIEVENESLKGFQELVQRGTNLWPDAPVEIKEFADLVTSGQVMQDYRKLAGMSPETGTILNNLHGAIMNSKALSEQQQTKAIHLDMEAVAAQALATFPGAITGGSSEQILPISRFEEMVLKFNEVYGLLQFHTASRQEMADRLKIFKKLIAEELDEIDEIIGKLELQQNGVEVEGYASPIDAITDIADLCGDIQVFAASEMVRFNIPVTPTQLIIMDSNMSKLDADGKPIYRESDGKVMKGPNYWKPEPKIREMLEMHLSTEIRVGEPATLSDLLDLVDPETKNDVGDSA